MKISKSAGLLAAVILALSSGCGGGGSSSPAVATATVSGTVATGAAIAGGSVSLNCVSGATGIATTAADGSYSLSVSGITFPCVARATYGASDKLHSYVSAAGTVNITPVTELLVASLTGGSAADAFDRFDPSKARALTASQLTSAIAAVKGYLLAMGVSVADFPADPIGIKLVAKAGLVSGDKFDAVLDELAAKLKATGKKLGDAVGDIASGSGPTTSGTSTTAAGSPGTLTVSSAAKASRNGSFTVTGGLFVNADSSGFNGSTKDGLFETETAWVNGTNLVLKAAVWYFEGPNQIIFFACDNGQNRPCKGVTYDGTLKTLTFSNTVLPEIGGSTTVTVNGSIAVK